MAKYQNELVIDFGEVGFRNSKHPFRVRLDSSPLRHLIEAAENAHRVYELLLIDRPGDIWAYTSVIPDHLPPLVASRVARARDQYESSREGIGHPWPDGRIPFEAFDQLFYWAWDDTEPEDQAWLTHRDSSVMWTFADQSLAIVRAAQSRLTGSDHLLRHIVASVRENQHPYCYLDRRTAITKCQESRAGVPNHTPAFYEKLEKLLRDGDLASVAYRANGDHRVLFMMANEQRRRAQRTGHRAGYALHLSALVNNTIDNDAWDSKIWFFSEGLAHGDLYIDGGDLGCTPIKELIETGRRMPGKYILSTQDEGQIAGFDTESGDGWVMYRRQQPDNRRVALEKISDRRLGKLGAILSFPGGGATIYDYEKVVVIMGLETSAASRSTLASVIAEWQGHGGDPLLVVHGETQAFDHAGCRGVLTVPGPEASENDLQCWFADSLQRIRPWIDVVLALNAPDWATKVLARQIAHSEGPWLPWIVATPDVQHLQANLVIEGDLNVTLQEVLQRAKGMRRHKL